MLVTKACALKNYLEDFSIMEERNEEELVMWEYYLVYAVALGVNETDDDIIEKYIGRIHVERELKKEYYEAK